MSMKNKQEVIKYSLSFGCLAPSVKEQLNKQGFRFTKWQQKRLNHIQKLLDAVNMLFVPGMITLEDRRKIYKRILKNIDLILKEKNDA
jgi:hypothetical protein